MKKLVLFCLFFLVQDFAFAQSDSLIYHPEADAKAEFEEAARRAVAEKKHVVVMIGGNWCRWCRIFEKFRLSNQNVVSAVDTGFVWMHLNYSKENKNPEMMARLGYPQRFGFPVFVVLDGSGQRLHTQNSAYLEEDEGYSEKKVVEFLQQWSPAALQPGPYEQQR